MTPSVVPGFLCDFADLYYFECNFAFKRLVGADENLLRTVWYLKPLNINQSTFPIAEGQVCKSYLLYNGGNHE